MARIKFDYSNVMNFVNDHELGQMQKMVSAADEELRSGTGAGGEMTGWLNLPTDYDKEEFARIKAAAKKIQSDSKVLVVIGIGGSYLGAKAAVDFLHSYYNNYLPDDQREFPQVLFAGNSISPAYVNDLIKVIGNRDFSVNIISKSGTTTEPAIAFRIFKELLEKKYGKDEARKRIYATTDAKHGALKTEADAQGYESFVVPDAVGGRFTVLTPCGLLPIAASGANIDELMAGAREAQNDYVNPDLNENGAYQYAAMRNILYRKGYNTEILTNWEPTLQYIGEWWKQLQGESEGKDHKGIYPSSANFSTDLHSLGQYIQDGQRNLMETTVKIATPVSDLLVPTATDDLDGLAYLQGKNMSYVNDTAMQGTIMAHVEGGVPNMIIEIEKQDEFSLGYLFYFFEVALGISGYLNGINPFNQPGVEAYKTNMFALLGKPGYEAKTKELRERI